MSAADDQEPVEIASSSRSIAFLSEVIDRRAVGRRANRNAFALLAPKRPLPVLPFRARGERKTAVTSSTVSSRRLLREPLGPLVRTLGAGRGAYAGRVEGSPVVLPPFGRLPFLPDVRSAAHRARRSPCASRPRMLHGRRRFRRGRRAPRSRARPTTPRAVPLPRALRGGSAPRAPSRCCRERRVRDSARRSLHHAGQAPRGS